MDIAGSDYLSPIAIGNPETRGSAGMCMPETESEESMNIAGADWLSLIVAGNPETQGRAYMCMPETESEVHKTWASL